MTVLARSAGSAGRIAAGKPIKLVIWDLDDTLWDGVLLEGDRPALFPHLKRVIVGLDELGILQSIASRNDCAVACGHLRDLDILQYFLAPRIDWSAKSQSVATIVETLNIGLDCVLFIDDQGFEREEVCCAHPQVRTLSASEARYLLDDPQIMPAVVTDDAPLRRVRYLEAEVRARSEREFTGPAEQFLRSLNLELTVDRATASDLDRTEELIARTNQLNSTGVLYSRDELQCFLASSRHTLLVASLRDRFGDYGRVGIVLLEAADDIWTVKLLLVSCRVLSRGIGPILLSCMLHHARGAKAQLRVEFRETGRNRPMRVALMMTGFTEKALHGGAIHLYHDGTAIPALPPHLLVRSHLSEGGLP
jgi:FkbH-like protein